MIETMTDRAVDAVSAFAASESGFGVRPLVEAFFDGPGAFDWQSGALGLFTPTPDMTWEAAAVAGERVDREILLRGEVRVANPRADGVLVLVRLEDEYRLAWVDARPADGRLRLDGVAVGPRRISTPSKPVTFDSGSGFLRCLDAYAGAWALSAALQAGADVRALRRAARTTSHGGKAFSASQWVAMEITGVEIEAELTLLAARMNGAGGFAAAAAAARTLHAIAAKAVELRDQAGLEIDGQPQEAAAALTAFLGGPLRIESELARSLGIEVRA